jgi:hypothetical protein
VARNDIRPWRPDSGGFVEVTAFPLAAAQNFNEGEPVVFDGSGAIQEAADDPTTLAGIAATRSIDVDGVVRATGTPISTYRLSDSMTWVCRNFATDGAGTTATPTQANAIGQLAGLTLTGGGAWVVDTGTANLLFRIEDVVNASGVSITNPLFVDRTGVSVVMRIV